MAIRSITPETRSGSKGQIDVFVGQYADDNSWEWLKADGSTKTTAPTRDDCLVYALTYHEDTKFTPTEAGALDIAINNYDDSPDIYTYLITPYATAASAGNSVPDWYLETGQLVTSTTGSKVLVFVNYGSVANSKMKMSFSLGSLKSTSGAWTQKYKEGSKPTIEIVGDKSTAAIVIDTLMFDSNKNITTLVDATITSGAGFTIKFETVTA